MDTKKLDEFIAAHRDEQGALISILHDIQREAGCVPDDAMAHLSKALQVPLSEVFRVVSYFDKAFSLKPREKHSIKVCQGTACYLKHADQVLTELKEELGEDGEAPGFQHRTGTVFRLLHGSAGSRGERRNCRQGFSQKHYYKT